MDIKAIYIEDYNVLRETHSAHNAPYPFPYVKNANGSFVMKQVSPLHGRSFLVDQVSDTEWIISKGNGLGYSSKPFLLNSDIDSDTWGGLSAEQAIRDFDIGCEIRGFGIKTNQMQYVLELPYKIIFRGQECHAALLQYSVECPYRIVDFPFCPKDILSLYIAKWQPIKKLRTEIMTKHLIAADILYYNLSKMHQNGILHNAITPQNYTWALELVDFEASHTPNIPFGTKEYQSYIPMLMDMEILQTYEIINYIAWCLGEMPDYKSIERIMDSYGFQLKQNDNED